MQLPPELCIEVAKFLPVVKTVALHSLNLFLRSLRLPLSKITYNEFALKTYDVKCLTLTVDQCDDLRFLKLEKIRYPVGPGHVAPSVSFLKLPHTLKSFYSNSAYIRIESFPLNLHTVNLANYRGHLKLPASLQKARLFDCDQVDFSECVHLKKLWCVICESNITEVIGKLTSLEFLKLFLDHGSLKVPKTLKTLYLTSNTKLDTSECALETLIAINIEDISDKSFFANLQALSIENITQADLLLLKNLRGLHLYRQNISLDFSHSLVETLVVNSLNCVLDAPLLKELLVYDTDETFGDHVSLLSNLSKLQVTNLKGTEIIDIRHLPLQQLIINFRDKGKILVPEGCEISYFQDSEF